LSSLAGANRQRDTDEEWEGTQGSFEGQNDVEGKRSGWGRTRGAGRGQGSERNVRRCVIAILGWSILELDSAVGWLDSEKKREEMENPVFPAVENCLGRLK